MDSGVATGALGFAAPFHPLWSRNRLSGPPRGLALGREEIHRLNHPQGLIIQPLTRIIRIRGSSKGIGYALGGLENLRLLLNRTAVGPADLGSPRRL